MAKVLGQNYFTVVEPKQGYKGMTYGDLITEWWNWIYSANPDSKQMSDPLLLRGDILGDPIDLTKLGRTKNPIDLVKNPKHIYNRTNRLGIHVTSDTSIFLPVYGSQFVLNDKFEGKEIKTMKECRAAAQREFRSLSDIWATVKLIEGGRVTLSGKIVNNLEKFYVESTPFKMQVSKNNRLNREPKFYLKPGEYKGIGVGIYLLIHDFRPGTYRLDFGGISKANFFSRAIYDIIVSEPQDLFRINDISDVMARDTFQGKSSSLS